MPSTTDSPALPLANLAKGKPYRWKPGESGNPAGRRTSTIKTADTAEAKAWALPRVQRVLKRLDTHLSRCGALKDCGMCKHYNTVVLEYAYGKPPQRHEIQQAARKQDIAALAKAMGLTETEAQAAVAEVERSLVALKAAQ